VLITTQLHGYTELEAAETAETEISGVVIPNTLFRVSVKSGKIALKGLVDYEIAPTYEITVVVADTGTRGCSTDLCDVCDEFFDDNCGTVCDLSSCENSLSSISVITIEVEDVNEPPELSFATRHIAENSMRLFILRRETDGPTTHIFTTETALEETLYTVLCTRYVPRRSTRYVQPDTRCHSRLTDFTYMNRHAYTISSHRVAGQR
jgi:hypothetical protein